LLLEFSERLQATKPEYLLIFFELGSIDAIELRGFFLLDQFLEDADVVVYRTENKAVDPTLHAVDWSHLLCISQFWEVSQGRIRSLKSI
jgi:hypothetical protein